MNRAGGIPAVHGEDVKQHADTAGHPVAGGRTENARTAAGGSAPPHPEQHPERPWLGRRRLLAAYAAFTVYAVAAAVLSGGRDQVWSIWAACGYALALVMLWRWPSRRGLLAAVLVSVALAVLAPLLWLSVAYPLEDGMMVIDRAASLLLHHGTPYLAAGQVTSWLSYNPYLPLMTLSGLPSAGGLGGLAGNSGVWIAVGTVIPLAAAFWIAVPHRGCPVCRRDALLATAAALASPVLALNLAVITTDPPVLALILLALALAARTGRTAHPGSTAGTGSTAGSMPTVPISGLTGSGIALGAACDLKSTAWLAVPVLAAMFAARDGARAAARFLATAVVTAVILIAALAPAALTSRRGADALVQNSVLFPLGLTRYKTPADSLLLGHVLSDMGSAGHVLSVALLLAAGLGIAISLVIRPPRDVPAATWRLAIGLALMFLLGPQVRFGYFIYPLGLVGWLALIKATPPARRGNAGHAGAGRYPLGAMPRVRVQPESERVQ